VNKFIREITETGFMETLELNGKVIKKEYKRTDDGYIGQNQSWDLEDDLPEEVIVALEHGDEIEIMDVLQDYSVTLE
jgi:hypothetical protein